MTVWSHRPAAGQRLSSGGSGSLFLRGGRMGFEALMFSGQTEAESKSSAHLTQGNIWGPTPVALQTPKGSGHLPLNRHPAAPLQGREAEVLLLTMGHGGHTLEHTSPLRVFWHIFWWKAVVMDVCRHYSARYCFANRPGAAGMHGHPD